MLASLPLLAFLLQPTSLLMLASLLLLLFGTLLLIASLTLMSFCCWLGTDVPGHAGVLAIWLLYFCKQLCPTVASILADVPTVAGVAAFLGTFLLRLFCCWRPYRCEIPAVARTACVATCYAHCSIPVVRISRRVCLVS